jgi:hypothetical protein
LSYVSGKCATTRLILVIVICVIATIAKHSKFAEWKNERSNTGRDWRGNARA